MGKGKGAGKEGDGVAEDGDVPLQSSASSTALVAWISTLTSGCFWVAVPGGWSLME
jgi:hypothetical protein